MDMNRSVDEGLYLLPHFGVGGIEGIPKLGLVDVHRQQPVDGVRFYGKPEEGLPLVLLSARLALHIVDGPPFPDVIDAHHLASNLPSHPLRFGSGVEPRL